MNAKEAKEYFIKIANEVCYGFKVDLSNRDLYNFIFWYADRSKKFTDLGYEFEKGICVYSPISGNGKTMALSILQRIFLRARSPRSFWKISMRDLAKEFQEQEHNPLSVLDRFREGNWLIDDLCCEEERFKYYGDNINLGSIVVNFIYPRFLHGQIFHFTANATKETMPTFYDNRTITRLIEMANRFEFNGRCLRNESKPRPRQNSLTERVHEPISLTEEQKVKVKQQIEDMKRMFSTEREVKKVEIIDYKGQWLDNIRQVAPTLSKTEIVETVKALQGQMETNGRAVDKESILEAIKILENAE